jgi:hypothetical protein
MKKINDDELHKMIAEGILQKDCAEHFNVSTAAICQRLKIINSHKLPDSFKKLTTKERDFVMAKADGFNNKDAVKLAYDVSTDASAKSFATILMRDPDIKTAIHDLMHTEGIGRRRRIQRLWDMIESQDMSAVGKGLDMSFKLTGEYSPEKFDVMISDDDIRALLATLPEIRRRLEVAKKEDIESEKSGQEN